MKRFLALILLGALLATLTACSVAPYTCDLCGEEATSKKHTADYFGEKITVCDECYQDINAMMGN